jgi:hypothetical protein
VVSSEELGISPGVKTAIDAQNCKPRESLLATMRGNSSYPYSNRSITISGFDPSRSGGPQVPAPLEVKTCIFPIRLKP